MDPARSRRPAPERRDGRRGRVVPLEWGAVALLFTAALFARARDLGTTFDRHFEGYQGAFFSTAAVNYERLGIGAVAGYPVLNIQVEPGSDPDTWYVYPNHSPLVPLMTWASAKLFGPDGWDTAWREHRAPSGLEPAARFPFLLSSLLGVLALWWAVRQAAGVQAALLALALYAALPLSAAYGTLVNYEKPSLVGVFLAYGWYARWVRGGSRRALVFAGASFALAGAVTYGPAFFVPPLVVHAFVSKKLRGALAVALATGLGVLTPVVVHALWVRSALAGIGRSSEGLVARIGRLLGPIFDGELPFSTWCGYQVERCLDLFTVPMCAAALLGLGWTAWSARRGGPNDGDNVSLGPPLAFGGLLLLLGYYRHTFDEPPQDSFLLNLAPGVAVLAASALHALAGPLYRARAGVGPLVVVSGLVVFPALARQETLRRDWRLPGPSDPGGGRGPDLPLPATVGQQLAEVLPVDAAGVHPRELAFNLAVSYYAWRTLWGVSTEETGPNSYEHADATLNAIGLGEAPRYVVLPRDPWEAARASVSAARPDFDALGPPTRRTDEWDAWLVNP